MKTTFKLLSGIAMFILYTLAFVFGILVVAPIDAAINYKQWGVYRYAYYWLHPLNYSAPLGFCLACLWHNYKDNIKGLLKTKQD